jgi:transglutaminase-like putative cysteine protease
MFRFDFAPYVRLESEIRTSDQAVLLFRTEGQANRYLLRRFVLSGYAANQGFFMQKEAGIDEYPSVVPDAAETFPDPGYRERQQVSQEYYFLTLDPSSLISLNYPLRVAPLRNWKSSSFLRVYRVDSRVMRSLAGPRRLTAQPPMRSEDLQLYTRTGGDDQIHDLALQVTKEQSGYFAKVAAIEKYLKTNYLYSLKPGIAEDGNQLRHFLFVSKKGYCSYFAFAMALMARSLGIPARVAVGFYVDPQSEVLNFYEVRAFQAHAWVEVYFGSLGWVEFDPTSDVLAPGEDFSPFPAPDKDRMARLIAEIVKNQTDQEEQAPKVPTVAASASLLGREIARIALLVARLWYVVLPGLYLLLLVCTKLLPLVPGLLSRDARRRARADYTLCLVRCAGVGRSRRTAESALEHAARLARESSIALAPVVDFYLKSAFGERFEWEDLDAAQPALEQFASTFRRNVAWPLRILGMMNPLGAFHRRT